MSSRGCCGSLRSAPSSGSPGSAGLSSKGLRPRLNGPAATTGESGEMVDAPRKPRRPVFSHKTVDPDAVRARVDTRAPQGDKLDILP
eukprot:4023507-Pyramimonas_sp.AAC.1